MNYCIVCRFWKKIVGFYRCRECYDSYYGGGQ